MRTGSATAALSTLMIRMPDAVGVDRERLMSAAASGVQKDPLLL